MSAPQAHPAIQWLTTERQGHFLQALGFHASLMRPLLPTYALLFCYALGPIWAAAHASLRRPSSVANSSKGHENEEGQESETAAKMECLDTTDALLMPFFAGITLVGLFALIKWLDDPALISKLLNWYFAIFGVLSLAALFTDLSALVHDFIFPRLYSYNNELWIVDRRKEAAVSSSSSKKIKSPLPGVFSILPLPVTWVQYLWSIRAFHDQKLQLRAYLRHMYFVNIKVGPFAIFAFFLAAALQVYSNIVSHLPWFINNLSAFGFVYSALQLVSPTTAATATLILCALFAYDIYFVFYTPVMVEVATKLDVPAKMLFPRPDGMSMLGLGDLVLPGMVIGFALRFDLWLAYHLMNRENVSTNLIDEPVEDSIANRTRRRHISGTSATRSTSNGRAMESHGAHSNNAALPKYRTAAGNWGTRFWISTRFTDAVQSQETSPQSDEFLATLSSKTTEHIRSVSGGLFSKPYFYSTMLGYAIGMMVTLVVMQVFNHPQPALLYLVPGVLGAMWFTAIRRGEVSLLWNYSELDPQLDSDGAKGEDESGKGVDTRPKSTSGWWRNFFAIANDEQSDKKGNAGNDKQNAKAKPSSKKPDTGADQIDAEKSKIKTEMNDRLIFFEILTA